MGLYLPSKVILRSGFKTTEATWNVEQLTGLSLGPYKISKDNLAKSYCTLQWRIL